LTSKDYEPGPLLKMVVIMTARRNIGRAIALELANARAFLPWRKSAGASFVAGPVVQIDSALL
jgi:hypothetical protein